MQCTMWQACGCFEIIWFIYRLKLGEIDDTKEEALGEVMIKVLVWNLQNSHLCLELWMDQVEKLQQLGESVCGHVSTDGADQIKGEILGLDMVNMVQSGELKEGSLIRVIESSVRRVDDTKHLSITLLESNPMEVCPSQCSDLMEGIQESNSNSAIGTPSPPVKNQAKRR